MLKIVMTMVMRSNDDLMKLKQKERVKWTGKRREQQKSRKDTEKCNVSWYF